jgi:2-dehydro-3-deoxyphosphogluconate aldolase/(4S)-4-hydroxy-2-oxoglutarate aldolase
MPSTVSQEKTVTRNKILKHKIVAIIRLNKQSDVAPLVDCLVEAGIKVLEITSNTPGFEQEIKNARIRHQHILVGAGTITNTKLAQRAINAGAQFIVTPNTDKRIVSVAHQCNLPVLMGALTPTDIANAIEYNADIIKVFPAGSMGIDYFKALKGPFDSANLMPVGGINLNNITQWFDAGACGVAISSDFSKVITSHADKQALTQLVHDYLTDIPTD